MKLSNLRNFSEGHETPNDSTPNEVWALRREHGSHWYNAQADYVQAAIGNGPGKCLVVGSPVFELLEIQAAGWDTTYVDLRTPPIPLPGRFLHGDAAQMSLGENEYDVASSTCVLCHAGTKRYGDKFEEEGDRLLLANIRKALKPAGTAVIMFGPVYEFEKSVRVGMTHRIYTIKDAIAITEGFAVAGLSIFDSGTGEWTNAINDRRQIDANYLSMILRKI